MVASRVGWGSSVRCMPTVTIASGSTTTPSAASLTGASPIATWVDRRPRITMSTSLARLSLGSAATALPTRTVLHA